MIDGFREEDDYEFLCPEAMTTCEFMKKFFPFISLITCGPHVFHVLEGLRYLGSTNHTATLVKY